jgi:hypothetical protein
VIKVNYYFLTATLTTFLYNRSQSFYGKYFTKMIIHLLKSWKALLQLLCLVFIDNFWKTRWFWLATLRLISTQENYRGLERTRKFFFVLWALSWNYNDFKLTQRKIFLSVPITDNFPEWKLAFIWAYFITQTLPSLVGLSDHFI